MTASTKSLMSGLFWGAIAVAVLSGSLVMLRLGVKTSLTPFDLAALRFGVASLLLCGVIWQRGWALEKLGVLGVVALITCNGAPYIMVLSFGFEFAPASDAGAINPGLMAVFVGILGWIVLGETMRPAKVAGILAVLAGTALFTDLLSFRQASIGHLVFATTGGMWASYVIIVRKTNVPALHATAIVAVGSALSFLPVYFILCGGQILQAPMRDIAAQAVYQGALTGALAVFAFTKSTEYLGASAGAALTALIPIVTLVMGAAFLGETVDGWKIIACALVGLGVFLALFAQRPSVVNQKPELVEQHSTRRRWFPRKSNA
ncbi:DMT family transporter [Rhodophyticola sp. CCM32]|uniref:DMT family transporter n=1 Tax=Rhodophyticola sp. CCM32 TaxID=2916397 RepID=UPI00107FC03F|nr:DMT family transporter [Rhodophyticola sp. CCM32]QBY02547.1 DMT family transporter [Rhodophyticola sp. CCM32]